MPDNMTDLDARMRQAKDNDRHAPNDGEGLSEATVYRVRDKALADVLGIMEGEKLRMPDSLVDMPWCCDYDSLRTKIEALRDEPQSQA